MSSTIRDAQDAIMKGRNQYRNFRDEFAAQFFQPEVDLQVANWWRTLPMAVKNYYKETNKKVYDDMQKKFGGE